MGLTSFISRRVLASFHYSKTLFKWERNEEGGLVNRLVWKEIPLEAQLELRLQLEMSGQSGILNIHCLQQVLAFGPKILRLKELDFEILEKTDVNLLIED